MSLSKVYKLLKPMVDTLSAVGFFTSDGRAIIVILSKFKYKPLRSYFTKSSIDTGLVVCELSLESLNLLNS